MSFKNIVCRQDVVTFIHSKVLVLLRVHGKKSVGLANKKIVKRSKTTESKESTDAKKTENTRTDKTPSFPNVCTPRDWVE